MKTPTKQVSSFSLDGDVLDIIKKAEAASGINRSSIVQTAILYWWHQKKDEWAAAGKDRKR